MQIFGASGTLHTPNSILDIARADLVKKMIMQSRVFSSKRQGDHKGGNVSGEEWEDQILVLVKYSLNRVRTHAGARMKGGGGKL